MEKEQIITLATGDWGNELSSLKAISLGVNQFDTRDEFISFLSKYSNDLEIFHLPRPFWERYEGASREEVFEVEEEYPDLAAMREAVEEAVEVIKAVRSMLREDPSGKKLRDNFDALWEHAKEIDDRFELNLRRFETKTSHIKYSYLGLTKRR